MPVVTVLGFTFSALAAVGTAVAVGGTVASIVQNKKAAGKQEQAYRAETTARRQNQLIAENRNRQSRIATIRRARQASANVRQQAVNIGAESSTSAESAATNPFTRAGANFGFQNEQIGYMRTRNSFLSTATGFRNEANKLSSSASTFGAIASMGSRVASAAGGFNYTKAPTPSAGQAWADASTRSGFKF